MKKLIITALLVLLNLNIINAQKKYKADWESLDSRPLPTWFADAKFGIFIHWGPYSVPAWSPKGTYSEWYQYWLQSKTLFGNGDFAGNEIYDFHRKTYGEDFSYFNFGEMFKADLFNPDEWASLFENSGAKYIVITTKHHDGFCLWPSKEANDRGFPWNSAEIGPKRDLIGDLTKAVNNTDVKMGFYYSLYEWYHPWWINDKERFVNEHFHPQFKDLIEKYQPDIIWGDGEWDLGSDKWKTPELMTWLFNESSVKNKIVTNDRWGKEIRKHHGGYFTTEYESGAVFNRPWEECRGMGFSFGFNQEEDIEDYNSAKTLVLMLVDIVSQGGNLLLDIGPDSRGNIPVIMQERLLQIGDWLNINGAAIYGTTAWKNPVQWTEGKREGHGEEQHYQGGDYILKQTVDVKEGFAAKEIFFSYKDGNLFAITPKWPGENLVIKNIQENDALKIFFLDSGEELKWTSENGDLVINLSEYNPNKIKSDLAYAFKISGIKNFVYDVEIDIKYNGFNQDPVINMNCRTKDAKVYYTLDGTEPNLNSEHYSQPFHINQSEIIKARAFKKNHSNSGVTKFDAKVITNINNLTSSVLPASAYSGRGLVSLVDQTRGSTDCRDGNWLGFQGEDVELNLVFEEEVNISTIELGILDDKNSWIFNPEEIKFSISNDENKYVDIGRLTYKNENKVTEPKIIKATKEFNNVLAKNLKLEINAVNQCPDWHNGAGEKAWLFIDEIIIK